MDISCEGNKVPVSRTTKNKNKCLVDRYKTDTVFLQKKQDHKATKRTHCLVNKQKSKLNKKHKQ